MNYHQTLLKILPKINDDMRDKLLNDIMVHAPKAVIDAFKRVNGEAIVVKSEPYRPSKQSLNVNRIMLMVHSINGRKIPASAAKRILRLFDEGRRINAIKELRTVSGLDLIDAKNIIDQFR